MNRWTALLLAVSLVLGSSSLALSQEYPVVKGYGPAYPVPNAAFVPDKALRYKILFDIRKASGEPDEPNPGLAHVARFLNVMDLAGVTPPEMDVVAIVHGPSTRSVLKNAEYKKQFKVDNPNSKLVQDLVDAGVKVMVCGQALHDNHFERDWVNPEIGVALSALVVVPTYQLWGYAYMPF